MLPVGSVMSLWNIDCDNFDDFQNTLALSFQILLEDIYIIRLIIHLSNSIKIPKYILHHIRYTVVK